MDRRTSRYVNSAQSQSQYIWAAPMGMYLTSRVAKVRMEYDEYCLRIMYDETILIGTLKLYKNQKVKLDDVRNSMDAICCMAPPDLLRPITEIARVIREYLTIVKNNNSFMSLWDFVRKLKMKSDKVCINQNENVTGVSESGKPYTDVKLRYEDLLLELHCYGSLPRLSILKYQVFEVLTFMKLPDEKTRPIIKALESA